MSDILTKECITSELLELNSKLIISDQWGIPYTLPQWFYHTAKGFRGKLKKDRVEEIGRRIDKAVALAEQYKATNKCNPWADLLIQRFGEMKQCASTSKKFKDYEKCSSTSREPLHQQSYD
ncbi:unnamed protein product, partial [marine sediment metagenome]